MFAGLPELFVILIVVFAAWHVVKAFNRMQQRSSTPPQRPRARPQAPGAAARPVIEAEDLVDCRVCRSYVAVSARHCGRADCPQPR
jgi:hypothetical protein